MSSRENSGTAVGIAVESTTAQKTRKEEIWHNQAAGTPRGRKFTRPWTALPVCVLGSIVFALAILLRPFGQLRIGMPTHRAMGRFYGGMEYFLRLRKAHPPSRREFVVLISGTPVNRQILDMAARQVRIIKSDWLHGALETVQKHNPDSNLWVDMGFTGWLRGAEWDVPGPQLSFTREEAARGQALLRQLGIPAGARHVCMFAKDRLYSDSPDNPPDPDTYWGQRDFRNCDIKTYLPAAQFLADAGIWVVRMGAHRPEEPLPPDLDAHIIDYTGSIRPTLADADFADTYLQASCRFFLGCTSGIYVLSSMFGVPVAYTNMVPYGESGRMPHDIIILKNCRDRATGTLIPYGNLIARGLDADWLTLEELEKLDADGIEFVDNTEDEILALAREMNQRLDGTWEPAPEDGNLFRKFRDLSPARAFDGSGFPGRVGAAFLRVHQRLLD